MTRRPRDPRSRRLWAWLTGAMVALAFAVLLIRPDHSAPSAAFPFPCLAQEALALHVHPYLRIVIDGRPVTVPAAIGIRDPQYQEGLAVAGACFEPLHTHDASGIIHIEGPDPNQRYTLGDFFAVWRATYPTVRMDGQDLPVSYGPDELLGRTAGGGHTVRLVVDGRPDASGPRLLLNALDYCSAQTVTPPCYPTAVGDPFPPFVGTRYGTGHTIVLEYR